MSDRTTRLTRRAFTAAAAGTACAIACAATATPARADTPASLSPDALEPLTDDIKPATAATTQANAAVYDMLDFADEQELEFAQRGLIAAPENLEIMRDDGGSVAWSQVIYDFVRNADAPDTANPSLWRNAQLNAQYGLFEVVEGIYQVRGYDIANITFVRGERGWIVFDCSTSVEQSRAAYELLCSQFGDVPVSAVVISHSHVDHYSGMGGVVAQEDLADASLPLEEQVASGRVPLIVPAGFTKAAIEENVFAGNAVQRRACFQYGNLLEKGPQGSLSVGIGLTLGAGTGSFFAPTFEVSEDGFEATIDGVRCVFQLTPGTEAPAEMNTYLPDYQALWMAENCTGTMHNLYTLRGAEVRDAGAWASFIMQARARFGSDAQVVFQSHNWPHWGAEVIDKYMLDTAAVYSFIHTQTLQRINQGMTPDEIAADIELPEALNRVWHTRQYYGTLIHNAKAVYQKYMGWYDANPVHLAELEPSAYAKKLVEYLGDPARVLELARADYEAGDYQWVAQIANTLVFADPANTEARLLCADALEQLGYQAESGAWRNAYLVGAYELRHGTGDYPESAGGGSLATARAMGADTMLTYLAICMDANAMADQDLDVVIDITDDGTTYLMHIHDGVLLFTQDGACDAPAATIHTKRLGILGLAQGNAQFIDACVEGVEGDFDILALLDKARVAFPPYFNIVEP